MPPPEDVCDVSLAADPVAAVLGAHELGRRIALPTSGTSATPRSVVRTTGSWVDSFPVVTDLLELGPSSRVWVPGPLTSTMNLFAAVHAEHAGAARVATLADATHACLTPAALSALLAGRPDLGGVHLVVAGDRLRPALADAAEAAGARVSHYYGAAELSFVAWGRDEVNLQPFPEVEVSVRDGEIWVRSPFLCEGYAGPPGPLRRAGDSADDWATVGDRGELSGDRLRVLGRGADVVVTAGVSVPVADVEAALRSAARGELLALGVPHPDLGEVLVGVLTERADLEPVRRRGRELLAAGARPRRWFHLARLPLTAAGKVDRAAVAAMLVRPDADDRRCSAATPIRLS